MLYVRPYLVNLAPIPSLHKKQKDAPAHLILTPNRRECRSPSLFAAGQCYGPRFQNIISIVTCVDPEENQIQKDNTTVNRIASDKKKPEYCKTVSDRLPSIVHKIVQNLRVDEPTLGDDAADTKDFSSDSDNSKANNVYCNTHTDEHSHIEWPDYIDNTLSYNTNTPKIIEPCDWIKQNRAVVNRIVPRVNLKIIVLCCYEKTIRYLPWECKSGLIIQVRYVPCSLNTDYRIKESFDSNVIGIVAPKPFFQNKEIDIPVIFYDASYLSPRHLSVFPYSFNDISHEIYKFALCDLMDSFGWSRIAIISDGSDFSNILNYDLMPYFHERKILYKFEECLETPCNFTEILNDLKAQDAKIIFANVDEENIASLSDAATRLNINEWEYVWIVRQKLPNTKIFYNYIAMFLQNLEKQDCLDSVDHSALYQMVRIYEETIDNKNASFYDDRITDGWTGYVSDEFKANFLRRRKDKRQEQTICVMNFKNEIAYTYKYDAKTDNLFKITHRTLYKDARPRDRSECVIEGSTSVYFTPCKHELLIVFPLVFLAFFVMFSLLYVLTRNVRIIYDRKYEIL